MINQKKKKIRNKTKTKKKKIINQTKTKNLL